MHVDVIFDSQKIKLKRPAPRSSIEAMHVHMDATWSWRPDDAWKVPCWLCARARGGIFRLVPVPPHRHDTVPTRVSRKNLDQRTSELAASPGTSIVLFHPLTKAMCVTAGWLQANRRGTSTGVQLCARDVRISGLH